MSDEEKARKRQIDAINASSISISQPATKRQRGNPPKEEDSDVAALTHTTDDDEYVIRGTGTKNEIVFMAVPHEIDLYSRVVIDSGCSRHCFADRSAFITYNTMSVKRSRPIQGIGGSSIQPMATGTVKLNYQIDGKLVIIHVPNVYHVPDMECNLLSVS